MNVLSGLWKLGREKTLSIHIEHGSYYREDQPHPAETFWGGGIEEINFAGISGEENVKWEEVFKASKSKPRWVYGKNNFDFEYEKIKEKGTGKSRDPSKDLDEVSMDDELQVMLSPDEATQILDMAPHFDLVGARGGWVNPHAKPQKMIWQIIEILSESGNYVILVFFSGGQVMKTSFILKRDIFCLL